MTDEQTVQVEALGDGGLKDAGHNLAKGDRVTVPRELAQGWCAAGWAKALDGSIETGERRVVNAKVQPVKAGQTQTSKEV